MLPQIICTEIISCLEERSNQIRRLTIQVSKRRIHERTLNLRQKSIHEPVSRALGSFNKAHIRFTYLPSRQWGYWQLIPWALEGTLEGSNKVTESSGAVRGTYEVRSWESLPIPSSQQQPSTIPEAAFPFSHQTSCTPRAPTPYFYHSTLLSIHNGPMDVWK